MILRTREPTRDDLTLASQERGWTAGVPPGPHAPSTPHAPSPLPLPPTLDVLSAYNPIVAATCPNCCQVYRYADGIEDCEKLVSNRGFCIRCGERVDCVAEVVAKLDRARVARRILGLPDDAGPPPPFALA